jgi:hypothetical protein
MSELIFGAAISHSEDIGISGSQIVVHFDTLLIEFDTCKIETNIFNIRFSSGCNQYGFDFDSLFNALLSVSHSDSRESTVLSGRRY